ncbi:MAG: DUF1232 domain-containing protein, partial [Dehalococcoidia bacterium]
LLRRMLSIVYLMTHPTVPLRLKLLPIVALVYFLWPRDLLPDYWFPIGLIDDFIIGFILLGVFTAKAWPYTLQAAKAKREMSKDSVKVDFKVVDDQGREQGEPGARDSAKSGKRRS